MKTEWLLVLLASLTLQELTLFGAQQTSSVNTNQLLRAVYGQTNSLSLGGLELTELPAEFDLNPNLKRDEQTRRRTGMPLKTKAVSLLISSRYVAADEISVRVTPFIDGDHHSGLLVINEVRNIQEGGTTKVHREATFTSKKQNSPVTLILGQDGQQQPEVSPSWCLFIALDGKNGIICWSETAKDNVIAPKRSGFRRFRLDGTPNAEGWGLLKPIVTK